MDRISELPKEILHRILYFLSQEDAVRPSVLSKSWRYNWCTRPNLDFSDTKFKGNKQQFLSVVESTLRQYRDQKMCLDEFHLSISLGKKLYHKSVSFLEKWMPRLRTMGVKESSLSIRSENTGCVKLPSIVFGAESLQDFQVEGFELDKRAIRRIVPLNHLKKLCLRGISIEDENFQKIISCCPLIETLILKECRRLKKIRVNDLHNLKHFYFAMSGHAAAEERCSIEIRGPSLESIEIENGDILCHEGSNFRNLKILILACVKSSLDNLSFCTFPSLECLEFEHCDGIKETQLFIDAPNIRDFEYDGDFVPSIAFAKTPGEWDSCIFLTHMRTTDGSSWFLKLKELLKSLRQPEISLYITSEYQMSDEDIIQENIQLQDTDGGDYAPVVVKLLSLHCPLSSISSFLNAVFCICRPRKIYNYKWGMRDIECLWKILTRREKGDINNKFRESWLRDLEEVSLEIEEKNREKEWRTITLSELRSHKQREHILTGFVLKWRQIL